MTMMFHEFKRKDYGYCKPVNESCINDILVIKYSGSLAKFPKSKDEIDEDH